MCNRAMDEEGQARVDRLVEWCKSHRIATTEDGQSVVPKAFADKMEALGVKGRDTYWMGILAKSGRSFGPKKAREIEPKLGMPDFYLEGGSSPAPSPMLRLIDLSADEMSLIMLYKELTPDRRHDLLVAANKLHNHDHPSPSAAHPFANAPAPGAPMPRKASKNGND